MPAKHGKRYLVLHGHFYQPPRENPWIEAVEKQPSAAPSANWNERVHAECYGPNSCSRLLDSHGRIRGLSNNYAWMSFNFGPTLLSWMETAHPETYARILEADKLSVKRLGHGNAMAQAHSHIILPLATARQKALQIEWGVRDFEARFGRKPEGLWLAETAIDMDTVVALIRAGIRFTVLAPTQAQRIRPLHGEGWTDVSDSSINPRRPYRIFPLAEDGTPLEKGYLDVFFYDGPISGSVGFEHLLRDARNFGNRILGAFDAHEKGDQLVSVCTDGESYGHHEAFGDMCAAHLLRDLCPEFGWEPVNYAWYLAHHEPQFEVRLKNAYDGGTAWSCAHGTGRWKEDCGCHTGGEPGWNQAWRGPLRSALDGLDLAAMRAFDAWAPAHFRDVDLASRRALEVFRPQADIRQAFFRDCLQEGASESAAWDTLELLRFSHYMYTSCGWFFTDLSGIETLQILKYALRALQILEAHGEPPETRTAFLKSLALARSNVGPNGAELFATLEAEALPATACLALGAWTEEFSGEPTPYTLTPFWRITSRVSRQSSRWVYHAYRLQHAHGPQTEEAWLAYPAPGPRAETYWVLLRSGMTLESIPEGFVPEGNAPFRDIPGLRAALPIPIGNLPDDIREKLALHLEKEFWLLHGTAVSEMEVAVSEHAEACSRLNIPPTRAMESLRQVLDWHHLQTLVYQWMERKDPRGLEEARRLSRRMRDQGFKPESGHLGDFLDKHLAELELLLLQPGQSRGDWQPFFAMLDLVDVLGWSALRTRLENIAEPLFDGIMDSVKTGEFRGSLSLSDTLALLDRLNFNVESAKERLLATVSSEAPQTQAT